MPAIALRLRSLTNLAAVILITGGTGFIGSHTAVEALSAGYSVVILDNLSNSSESVIEGIRKTAAGELFFVHGNCQDHSLLEKLFSQYKIRHVIHFAAVKSVEESIAFPIKYYSENISGLTALLTYSLRNEVNNFIFSSSAAVYGMPETLPLNESHRRNLVNSPYGFSKIVCEKMLEDVSQTAPTMNMVSLRYFNPIGSHPQGHIGELPRQNARNIMACLVQVAAGRSEKFMVYGNDYATADGSCVRDYMHVVDTARAHLAALQWLEKSGVNTPRLEAFNIGTGRGTSVVELLKIFETATGRKLNYEMGPRRAGDIPELYADVSKARAMLNWEAKFSVQEAVQDAQRWIRNIAVQA